MANHLATESSLYLKEHADNPVQWRPWGEEALREAREKNKLMIVSIGYSSCHWCHVMARECFEDSYIADLMNRHFVCIKVDREEYPEVDSYYMEVVQMINQRGGWPLNVFCLPDGRAFFGGTYFPAEDKGQGIIPWPQLLMRIAKHFEENPQELEENADNVVKNLQYQQQMMTQGAGGDVGEAIETMVMEVLGRADKLWGGFGGAPKFPSTPLINLLMEYRGSEHCARRSGMKQACDESILKSLTGMGHGGLWDQLGGGFARYTVDEKWMVPHFEKMLYDNALLLEVYAKGWVMYQRPLFKRIAHELVAWLQREMAVAEGGFAAAYDAESEGKEGQYYVWSWDEIQELLGSERAKEFAMAFGVTKEGNFEEGLNVLTWVTEEDERGKYAEDLDKLKARRDERVMPNRDDKVKVSWNALLVKSLVYAGYVFDEEAWVKAALELWDCLWERSQQGDKVPSILYGGHVQGQGGLEEHAFLAEAALSVATRLDVYDLGRSSEEFIRYAEQLVTVIDERFKDMGGVGYFNQDRERMEPKWMLRKEFWDQATPSGNSVMVRVLSCLESLRGGYAERYQEMEGWICRLVKEYPTGIAYGGSCVIGHRVGVPVVKGLSGREVKGLGFGGVVPRVVFYQAVDKKEDPVQLCLGSQCEILNGENIEEQLYAMM